MYIVSILDLDHLHSGIPTKIYRCTKLKYNYAHFKTIFNTFDRLFEKLLKKGIKIYIITRDPREHEIGMEIQSEDAIQWCEGLGIQVLLCIGNHHRKLAILDRKILWEGSLNILSQTWSREIMRKIESQEFALEMFNFLKLGTFL